MNTQVRDNATEDRYEIVADGQLAGFTTYHVRGEAISFIHTDVLPGFGGRGLATQLVRAELDDARRRELAVLPFCPFVRGTIAREPQLYLDLVPEARREEFALPDSV